MVIRLHFKHVSLDFGFIIDISGFPNGFNHPNWAYPQSISFFIAKLWKVVMKLKIVKLFLFLGPFLKNIHFWGCDIQSTQYFQW